MGSANASGSCCHQSKIQFAAEQQHHVEENSQIIPDYYSYSYYLCFLYPTIFLFCFVSLLSHHPSFCRLLPFVGCVYAPELSQLFCFLFVFGEVVGSSC